MRWKFSYWTISQIYDDFNGTNIATGNNSLRNFIPDELMELNLTSLDLSEYSIEENVCNFLSAFWL